MQVTLFENGGAVVHGILGAFSGRVSMWFDDAGRAIDAERFDYFGGPSRPVKVDGPIWSTCKARAGAAVRAYRAEVARCSPVYPGACGDC